MSAIQFSVEDLKTPDRLERVLRQFQAAVDSTSVKAAASSLPPISSLATQLAPLIRDQLQATGNAPLNLQSLLPAGGSTVFLEDTHANRLALYTPPKSTKLAFIETDRNVLYASQLISGAIKWIYVSGIYVSAFANRPADLVTTDTGFLFYATDQDTVYIWTGAAYDTISRRILLGGFFGIFTHANAADRTYTLPDATGNLVYETAALVLNNFLFGGGGALAKDSGFSVIPVANGGTNIASYTIGDLLYASAAGILSRLADVATGNALLSGGVGVAPLWGKIDLTAAVTGILPAANGGTAVAYNRIADTIARTAQSADIAATNFANTVAPGTYRVSYALLDTTADVTAGAVTLTIAWTDGAGATTVASAPVALTGVGTLRTSGVFFLQLASGNVTYAISHTGVFGTATYALYIAFERLS